MSIAPLIGARSNGLYFSDALHRKGPSGRFIRSCRLFVSGTGEKIVSNHT